MKWTEFDESRAIKKPTPTLIGFDKLYPDRDDEYLFVSRRGERLHVGYTHPRTRRCVCKTPPVFEQYIYDYDEDGNRNVPAKQFVAICPNCEIRARGHGSLEWCRRQWNSGKFSRDSVMMRYRPKWESEDGTERLCRKVVAGVIEEAVDAVKRKNRIQGLISAEKAKMKSEDDCFREMAYARMKAAKPELAIVLAELDSLTDFILYSPLMYSFDEEAVLSRIRKLVYPDLKMEDRLKIPLNLRDM